MNDLNDTKVTILENVNISSSKGVPTESPFKQDDLDIICPSEEELIKEYNPEKYHPYLYALKNVDWYIFGSLTWDRDNRRADSYVAEYKRQLDLNNLLKLFCGKFKIRRKSLLFYKTTEFGAADELHYHFLIAKNKCAHLPVISCCEALKDLWENQLIPIDRRSQRGLGTAYVVPYDNSKEYSALKYCLKREFGPGKVERERFDYLSDPLKKMLGVNN